MVLTKSELSAALQKEVRILLHLAGKIDPAMLDYRPTPKQRSTMELLTYLSVMGPALVEAAKAGGFDRWVTAATEVAEGRESTRQSRSIAAHSEHETLRNARSDADFRDQIKMFGSKTTRGAFIVYLVLCGCAAYRTQLFLYLKAGGHEEFNTMNLWGGADAPGWWSEQPFNNSQFTIDNLQVVNCEL